jgi:uncharacterized protein
VSLTFRTDRSRLGRFDRTGAGGVRVKANFSRTGIQVYKDAKGNEIREYRPADEVFSEDSIKSFSLTPVTIGHPKGGVNPLNAQKLTHGIIITADGREKIDKHEFVAGDLVLMTQHAIDGAERGDYVELSMGYTCELDFTPGVTEDGEAYHCVQRNIRANHVALLGKNEARAGKHAKLKLDGNEAVDDEETTGDTMDPKEIAELLAKLAAAQVELATEKGRADAAEAKAKDLQTKLDASAVDAAKEKGRADAAEAALKPLKEDAAKREAVETVERVKSVLGKDYKADGKSAHDVRCDALKAVKFDCAGKSEDFVAAYFEGRFAKGAKFDYNQLVEEDDEEDGEDGSHEDGEFDLGNAFLNLKTKKDSK